MANIIAFAVTGTILILLSIWTGYLAKEAKRHRFELKKEARNHQQGGFRHFWYANRFKLWWYTTFVLAFLGIGLIISAF